MTAAPRPGWYPDPAGATGLYRWWDGSRWAEVTSDSVHAPPPIPVEPELGHLGVALSRRASPLRVATALSLGFALFISASIGLGLVIWRDQPDTSAQRVAGGSAGRPSAGGVSSEPVGYLDESTRTATIGPASLTMPSDPYVLSPDPMTIRGVLDVLFWASAPVHSRYDGQHDWSSGVLLGRVSESSSHSDLKTEGRLALYRLSTAIFDQHPTQLKGLSWDERPGRWPTRDAVLGPGALPGGSAAEPLRHGHGTRGAAGRWILDHRCQLRAERRQRRCRPPGPRCASHTHHPLALFRLFASAIPLPSSSALSRCAEQDPSEGAERPARRRR